MRSSVVLVGIIALSTLLSTRSLTASAAPARPLDPRPPLRVDPVALLPLPADAPRAGYQLTLKLRDEVLARVDPHGRISSLVGADLSALTAVVTAQGLRFRPLIDLPEQRLQALEAAAAARSGKAQPDLGGMLIVVVPGGAPDALLKAGRALQGLSVVEYAYIQVIGVPPPGDIGTTTPLYVDQQGYLGPDPGIDAEYAWSVGATGANLSLHDCEYGWVATHEDQVDNDLIEEAGQTVPSWVAEYEWDLHGLAALGEVAAVENEYGTTGILHDAAFGVYPEYSDERGSRRVEAITAAAADASPGDVVMLEMQAVGGGGGYAPAETDPSVWTVVRAAVDAGVNVVAAAGNGTQNLDSGAYESYLAYGDSGAVIVGAGSGDTRHSAASFSTYGTRVNLQGWGNYTVFTLGYGDYASIDSDKNQTYTSSFAGTSSATPIVAGAVGLLSDFVLGNTGEALDPEGLRALLIDTGVPQASGHEIGPIPDLRAAFSSLDADEDGAMAGEYGGLDCDDADPSVGPDVPETWYDGLDSNCDGADDFDQDGDGFASDAYGGEDCDDTLGGVFPGAAETWYDGLDADCDGADDDDQDGDGYAAEVAGGPDCDDLNAAIFPGAEDAPSDGVDGDCDGEDAVVDTDGGDGGGGGDLEVKPTGCACSTGAPGAVQPWLLLGALGLLRRRARQTERS